jgi:hypothetical protein
MYISRGLNSCYSKGESEFSRVPPAVGACKHVLIFINGPYNNRHNLLNVGIL